MKLKLYMKSGNVITVNRVKDWKIKWEGNCVTFLSIERHKPFFTADERPIMGSIDLRQIEAIAVKKFHWFF